MPILEELIEAVDDYASVVVKERRISLEIDDHSYSNKTLEQQQQQQKQTNSLAIVMMTSDAKGYNKEVDVANKHLTQSKELLMLENRTGCCNFLKVNDNNTSTICDSLVLKQKVTQQQQQQYPLDEVDEQERANFAVKKINIQKSCDNSMNDENELDNKNVKDQNYNYRNSNDKLKKINDDNEKEIEYEKNKKEGSFIGHKNKLFRAFSTPLSSNSNNNNNTKQLIRIPFSSMNSILISKLKLLFLIMNLFLIFGIELNVINQVQAGFWTFYFPNMFKPSGYGELTGLIKQRDFEMNSIKDNYADIEYFWGLMKDFDNNNNNSDSDKNQEIYPEESVCSELFPMFRDMVIEYSKIDYEHFITPLKEHHDYLIKVRGEWYPNGEKSKNILPREWEQQLYEKDLNLQIEWLQKLTFNEEFKDKRKKMVELYNSVKRSLDNSLPCVYMKYAYRQIAQDINQIALEMNVEAMKSALEMVKNAYKRIDKFKESDLIAQNSIADEMKSKDRFEIKKPF